MLHILEYRALALESQTCNIFLTFLGACSLESIVPPLSSGEDTILCDYYGQRLISARRNT
jgi:hypothetical protein